MRLQKKLQFEERKKSNQRRVCICPQGSGCFKICQYEYFYMENVDTKSWFIGFSFPKVLTDSETVRWLNHTVEKIWPVCMEQIASQKILLPIIPWFLEKYKPWTAVWCIQYLTFCFWFVGWWLYLTQPICFSQLWNCKSSNPHRLILQFILILHMVYRGRSGETNPDLWFELIDKGLPPARSQNAKFC